MIDALWEWIIVGVVVLVLFGSTKKIPDFARNLGRATGEFKKGQAEIQEEIRKAMSGETVKPEEQKVKDEQAINLAKSMGIETENRNVSDVKKELAEKLKSDN
ncbi:MAG: twin-arginine translocase TatA/TatE family subunit [Candidatus Thermoplasmatota archaeon]|jgi:sec-independent protein translocase protein TatA|nr:twin-arginine translocase TatA/TatE family subunit [Candidatus Thermoplasmatota archaeon]MCL5790762.1 twin-arginine translocase TatA/TatE family subunit [Candidatus Thermoplasmatota archaeon]